MNVTETLPLVVKKRIYYACIVENRSMIEASRMVHVPYDQVKEYVYQLFSDDAERTKVSPSNRQIYPKKIKITSKFTGYYSELSEAQMLLGPPGYYYNPKFYSKKHTLKEADKVGTISPDRKSFTERLLEAKTQTS